MPYISKKSRKYIFSFLMALIVTACFNIFSSGGFMLNDIPSILYGGIIITWIITVRRRVTISYIKGYLVLGGIGTLLLFIMRMIRWEFFSDNLIVSRYTWYAYYMPITAIPMLSLFLALRVGSEDGYIKSKIDKTVFFGWLVMVFLVMTNDFHNFVFYISGYNESGDVYSYNFGYFLIVIWCIILTIISFVVLLLRSRNHAARNLSWIPVGIYLFFGLFLIIYVLNGGNSPSLFGHKLYNFQEIYSIMYIGVWEASLRIGLIPSNSDYDDIFKLADIKAAIAGENNILKYVSNDALPLDSEQVGEAVCGEGLQLDENRKVRAVKIPNGSIIWIEDHSTVNELNESLKEAIDRISEENSLLEIENEIKAEKQAIEVRNKLYDAISNRVRPQLEKIEEVLEFSEINGDSSDGIKLCTVLGAYVKRQANLSILTEQYRKLKLEELRFAVRESMENIKLLGIDSQVSGINTDTEIDGNLIILAYEVFEATVEAAIPEVMTISCIIMGNRGINLEIIMDTPKEIPDFSKFDLDKFGAEVSVLTEEEGVYVRFSADYRFSPSAGKEFEKRTVNGT